MKRLKEILSKVLGIEQNTITDELSPDSVETWDSFNGLMLVSELESIFQIKFTMEEVTEVKTIKQIKEALIKHGVVFSND